MRIGAWVAGVMWMGLALLAQARPGVGEVVRTSLSPQACEALPPALVEPYRRRGLGVQRCPAPAGYVLRLVSSDANAWLEVIHGGLHWSAERVVVYRPYPGQFPVTTGTVTWLRSARGGWDGLVFQVASWDEEQHRHVHYFALKAGDGHGPCLLGIFSRLDEALVRVKAQGTCVASLDAAPLD